LGRLAIRHACGGPFGRVLAADAKPG